MVLIITHSSWVVTSEMELPSGCEDMETVELLSSMEAGVGKRDGYGAKSGKCMRTGQVAVTLKQCEGEESQETGKQSFMRLLGHLSCVLPAIVQELVPFHCFTVCTQI